jgi:hypothetical protein
MRFTSTIFKQIAIFFILLSLMLTFISASSVLAQTQGRVPSPPTFPRCEDKLRVSRGDRKSENSGLHPIPGKTDIEGRNDIYTLTEGNFVQCTCEANGTRGVQTNWWEIQGLPLGRVDIDAFERAGWILINNGSGWDVLNTQYLAKTNDISCSSASAATAAPTRAVTSSRTPTPLNTTGSSCTSLTVSATRGRAPLTVQFTIQGRDPNGQIQEYELDTGDLVAGEEQVIKQSQARASYTYETPGTYKVVAWIKDSQDNWVESNACKKTITVTDVGIGGSGKDELPETGLSVAGFFAMMIVGEVGYLVYKRYQLV